MRQETPRTTLTPLPQATRSALRKARNSSRRKRLAVAATVAIVGLAAGSGFAISDRVSAEQAAVSTAQLDQTSGLRSEQLGVYAGVASAHVENKAEAVLVTASAVAKEAEGKVDATTLTDTIDKLDDYETLDTDTVVDLTRQVVIVMNDTQAAAQAYDEKVAAEAAAAAAAEALAKANTPEGAQATAREMAASDYGWGDDQFSCLSNLWQKESGWSYTAENASSGAYGIPQALPGSKMATIAADWRTNAATQIAWGLSYIDRSYGTPCAAWSHSQSVNWY
ncbi:hypothetical protein CLV49_1388 [Labedella gwakjiensis]|uniref:Phospholipase n=1 Tax=Labedella gwakjiensis TaxID=390269 RepID=A0A2P8GUZ3_9MICO|nr:hypothetical protein [Labedella gwakjiensis]PSL37781.1 hypothetical protein CLV49_1388 [Labedella gwakjiensis]